MNSVALKGEKFIVERAGKPLVMIVPIKNKEKIEFEDYDMSNDIELTDIMADSGAFDFLKNEPDLYSEADIIKK
jgi:hypothetical protein